MRQVEVTILETLELLNGYATIKELSTKSGYTFEYVRATCNDLRSEGLLQATNINPKIWSKPSSPLVPTPTLPVDELLLKKLAIIASRKYPAMKPHWAVRSGSIVNTTVVKLLELAELAGYNLIAVPKP